MANLALQTSSLLILAAFLLAGVSACTPPVTTDAPRIEGLVVDGVTGRPLENARVSVDCVGGYQEVGTDAAGSFHLPAMQTVNVPFITAKNLGGGGTLKIEAAGYRTYTESGLGTRRPTPGKQTRTPGTPASGRTGPDFDHVRIALTPDA